MIPKCIIIAIIGTCTALDQTAPTSFPSRTDTESAVKTLTTINEAVILYYSWLKRVPTNLQQLGPTDKADADAADLLPRKITAGIVNGYKFALTSFRNGWIITATPLT